MMTLRLAVLGDSIGFGIGATRTADTLAPRLVTALVGAGLPAEARVFAVPGARCADLGRQVTSAAGWQPDLALIVIGANDLTHFVPAEQAAASLGRAVRSLRELGAQVLIAPAPDLSIVPHVPPPMRPLVQAASTLLRQAQIRAILAHGGRIADPDAATAAAFAADPSLFCHDRFHPSSAGYTLIARALTPAVLAAAGEIAAADRAS